MESQSFPIDPTALVAADTSVVINLIATRFSGFILESLPNRIVVVEDVVFELEAGRRNGRHDVDRLDALVATGKIEVVHLGTTGIAYFTGLVSGSAADTLDDGEAATIAYALEHGAIALLDEQKATKICASRFPNILTGCTVDVLAHGAITSGLDRVSLAEAVFNALYFGRMRVPTQYVDWVVNLIGPDRTRRCVSLPKSIRLG